MLQKIWFEKAAQQGCAKAQYYAGRCYYDGFGTPRDFNKALELFQEAARQGHKEALFAAERCCAAKEDKNLPAAAEFLQAAISRGVLLADQCYRDVLDEMMRINGAVLHSEPHLARGNLLSQLSFFVQKGTRIESALVRVDRQLAYLSSNLGLLFQMAHWLN